MRVAEYVLPGHPDKLCDAVADGLVDFATALDPDAIVGVEVSAYRNRLFIDGRIAANGDLSEGFVEAAARQAYAQAGFGGHWGPSPEALRVVVDLCLGPLDDDERPMRRLADDQAICVGYACRDEATNFLTLEHFLAWKLARGLTNLRRDQPALGIGPDGKVLVAAEEADGEFRVTAVSLSLQHAERVDWVVLSRAARGLVVSNLVDMGRAVPEVVIDEDLLRIEINGGGQFTVGGPEGDNGLSGKKLVADAWGPSAPIDGGALSGKDPHKVDRCGALRARQIAREIVATGLASDAQVTLAFIPGDPSPSHFGILADGRSLSSAAVARWLKRHDLSIEGTNRELGLARVKWQPLAVWGHFTDEGLAWEGGGSGS